MDLISRQAFRGWTKQQNWMQINEVLTPAGRQSTYLTPAGTLIIALFDLKGNLTSVGQLVPVAQQPSHLPPGGLKP